MNWGGTHEENTAHDNNFRSRQLPDSGLIGTLMQMKDRFPVKKVIFLIRT